MNRFAIVLMAGVALAWPERVFSQHYRVRIDASAQSVSFRGLVADSIPASSVVLSPGGGAQTPSGYAVRCIGGDYCQYMRPGDALRAAPISSTINLAMWGLGVEGLSLQATGRVIADAGRYRVWPGTSPNGQLLEGYLEYQHPLFTLRAGRQLIASRLEPLGFDGALAKTRWSRMSLDFAGYAGWGLAQSTALGFSSPALNPLDEWRPRDRQLVAGAEVSWTGSRVDARTEYRREIDPQDHYFVSERATLSMGARVAAIRLVGGADFNLVDRKPGSADLTALYQKRSYSLTAGVRRYQPYFSLWTLWGAFSPVSYHAANASAEYRPLSWLSLHANGELYQYEDAEISTGLVPDLRSRGSRGVAGATVTLDSHFTVEGSASFENGPGASGRFGDGSVTYTPGNRYSVSLYGGSMARPLELRYYDATTNWVGTRGDFQFNPQHRAWLDVSLVRDARDRPDAGSSSLSQMRMRAGVSAAFGSRADRLPLPPARRSNK